MLRPWLLFTRLPYPRQYTLWGIFPKLAPSSLVFSRISVAKCSWSRWEILERNSDEAIEKNYKAVLIAQGLDKQRINYDAKNGVLKLAGSVQSVPQRTEAEKLAQSVPNVQQVVNQIEIKR